jgi:hypothetical protein
MIEYIEVEQTDIETANKLAHEVLGRTLDDLPPQTRRLLGLLAEMVQAECKAKKIERGDFRFSRRHLREAIAWGDTQLRVHLGRLVQLEYVVVHSGGRGKGFVYELCYISGTTNGSPVLVGLIDSETLRATPTSRGSEGEFAGGARGGSGPKAGGSRGGRTSPNAEKPRLNGAPTPPVPEKAYRGKAKNARSSSSHGGSV